MPSHNLFLRTNRAGVDRALYRCRAIGVGVHALRDAAQHLLRTGAATSSDVLRLFRGRVFHSTTTVATAAGNA